MKKQLTVRQLWTRGRQNQGLVICAVVVFAMIASPCSAWQSDVTEVVDAGEVNGSSEPETQDDTAQKSAKPAAKFLRLKVDEYGNPVALQTAATRYTKKDLNGKVQFEVVLESALYVADTSYFRGCQKRLSQFDRVLYESLALPANELKSQQSADSKSSAEAKLPSGFSMLRQLSTGTLGLAYQFEEMNYEQPNFVDADLTAEQMSQRMAEVGDNQATLFIDLLAHLVKEVNLARSDGSQAVADNASTGSKDAGAVPPSPYVSALNLSVLTDPDGIMKIRRMLAAALVDSQLLDSAYPPEVHQLLVGARNDQAMVKLKEAIATGDRQIAAYFGVGHMADFEQRLVDEMGMEKTSVRWRDAWDLQDGAIEGAPLEGLIESTFKDSFKNKLRRFARGLRDDPQTAEQDSRQLEEKDNQLKSMERTVQSLEEKLRRLQEQAEQAKKANDKKAGDKKAGEKKTDDKVGDDKEFENSGAVGKGLSEIEVFSFYLSSVR